MLFVFYRLLLILVHILIVVLVVAAGDVVHPLLVVQVPVNGQHDALFKGSFGVPAQIILDLGGVDAVAAVVTQTVGDVLDELLADALVLQTVVQLVEPPSRNVNPQHARAAASPSFTGEYRVCICSISSSLL